MLDDTPITVTLPANQLAHALGAVRAQLKKRERALARDNFVPEPGHVNLNEVKITYLRGVIISLDRALQEHYTQKSAQDQTCALLDMLGNAG